MHGGESGSGAVRHAVLFDVVTRDDERCLAEAQYRPIVEIVVIPLA